MTDNPTQIADAGAAVAGAATAFLFVTDAIHIAQLIALCVTTFAGLAAGAFHTLNALEKWESRRNAKRGQS